MITTTATGRLSADPELKSVNETPLATMTVVNERYRGSKAEPAVEYLRVEVWGKIAETHAEQLGKGHLIAVTGELRQNRWEAEDGSSRSDWILAAENIEYLAKPRTTSVDNQPADAPEMANAT